MRSNICAVAKIFNLEQIRKINEKINLSLIESRDNPADKAIKTSQVKFLKMHSIQNLIIDFCYSANNDYYGFDLFSLTSGKILNYNTYDVGEEYSWHIDADMKSPIRDVKLTCLLNLSEEKYDGGDLYLFRDKEIKVEKFDPGCAVIFPSFTNHRVSKISSGKRSTLAIWMWGPKFR